ncbi:MAG: hypothetical protein NTY81_00590 [Candidatus Staskawiczbacteria bacterium]|nr:hypothetical protein [Candidatus Staskawiczbacteria bacterium]
MENKKNNWLCSFEKNVYSQNGEDGILEKIFEIIKSDNKQCVEFGALDGKFLSNTYNLIENKGWSGALIESDEKEYEKLTETYSVKPQNICLNRKVNFEGEDTLDNILKNTPTDKNFDLLSIDIDGNDYHIWDSLKTYSPKVVVIEFNSTIPTDIYFVQERNLEVNQGSSLFALSKLARKKGYELVAATLWNGFFVKREFFNLFEIKDNSPKEIFKDTKYQTRIFQLYDGKIVVDGYKKLFWHGCEMNFKKTNPLPKFFRQYPGTMSPYKFFLLRIWRKSIKILRF